MICQLKFRFVFFFQGISGARVFPLAPPATGVTCRLPNRNAALTVVIAAANSSAEASERREVECPNRQAAQRLRRPLSHS